MATMFFGQYLLGNGAIDRAALLDALDRQRRSNFSLPELAVRQGLIERDRPGDPPLYGASSRLRDGEHVRRTHRLPLRSRQLAPGQARIGLGRTRCIRE